jgi:hypothetical protein
MAAAAVSRTTPPQWTRSTVVALQDRASLRPPVLCAPSISSLFHKNISCQTGRCLREHPWWRLERTISSPIGGGNRHRAPRLAFCLSRAGPGSEGVSIAHHEEVGGGMWHLSRSVPVQPDQDLAADANRRPLECTCKSELRCVHH